MRRYVTWIRLNTGSCVQIESRCCRLKRKHSVSIREVALTTTLTNKQTNTNKTLTHTNTHTTNTEHMDQNNP